MAASDLATAAVRRFAHDLANPLAALATAIDLLGEADPLVNRALAACEERLALQRTLFGSTGEGSFDRGAARALLAAEAARTPGIALEGSLDQPGEAAARAAAALAFLALGLVRGRGRIRIGEAAVLVEGRLDSPEGLDEALKTGTTAEPALVPAAFAAVAAGPVVRTTADGATRFAWNPAAS